MEKELNEDIIARYLEGIASEDEEKLVKQELSAEKENIGLRHYIHKDYERALKTGTHEERKLDHVLSKVHHTIRLNEFNRRKNIRRKLIRWYSAAAAVLLIPLVVGSLYLGGRLFPKKAGADDLLTETTLMAPPGARIQFVLPDGTKGWLNSNSRLTYNLPFKNLREVKLSGEVFLEVAHDAYHPFKVAGKDFDVKVLGTKFNFSSYPEDNYSEVVLVEGKVECSSSNLKFSHTLKPNERLTFNKDKLLLGEVDPEKFISWREGKLVFREDPMQEVAARLGRWYNVDVEIKDPELEKYSFRGTFQDDSLEEVLRLLKKTSPIDYKIIDRTKKTDGTFTRKRVLIYKR